MHSFNVMGHSMVPSLYSKETFYVNVLAKAERGPASVQYLPRTLTLVHRDSDHHTETVHRNRNYI